MKPSTRHDQCGRHALFAHEPIGPLQYVGLPGSRRHERGGVAGIAVEHVKGRIAARSASVVSGRQIDDHRSRRRIAERISGQRLTVDEIDACVALANLRDARFRNARAWRADSSREEAEPMGQLKARDRLTRRGGDQRHHDDRHRSAGYDSARRRRARRAARARRMDRGRSRRPLRRHGVGGALVAISGLGWNVYLLTREFWGATAWARRSPFSSTGSSCSTLRACWPAATSASQTMPHIFILRWRAIASGTMRVAIGVGSLHDRAAVSPNRESRARLERCSPTPPR